MPKPTGPEAEVAAATKLSKAVQDAQILLAYAAQKGIVDLPKDVVKTVVETAAIVRENKVDDAKEIAFWSALSALAKSVSPVSVSTLRATMDSHSKAPSRLFGIDLGQSSPARRAAVTYTYGTVAVVVLLVLAQIYWTFVNSGVSTIQNSRKQIAELEQQIQAQIDANTREAPKMVALRVSDTGSTAGEAKLKALFDQLRDHQLQVDLSHQLLEQWTSFLSSSSLVSSVCEKATGAFMDPCRKISRTQFVGVLLDLLQRIALPMLYGLLGSCVFVLRTLSSEISSRTFSKASLIGFKIRICLGMLGGMVVAWFVAPDSADGLFRSLSPFALAFLAGYSIELAFSAMDRFLTAFTAAKQEAK